MKNQEEDFLASLGYKQELNRTFGIWQLTAFGLNYMVPIAPAIVFGFILQASGGTVALPYLLALAGVLFTALGYIYFIKRYPISGSLYTYVSRSLGQQLGFISGWSILLDYILIPTLTAMSASHYLHALIPRLPYEVTLVFFIIFTGLLNLIGAKPLGRMTFLLLLFGETVIFIAFFVWGYSVFVHHTGMGTLISTEPFHFSNVSSLTAAAAIAMLSYLGFDAITTLAEEAKNPRRDIPRAIFLSLFIGSLTMILTGYLGMLLIPDWATHIHNDDWLNATLFFVSKRAGGETLMLFYTVGFVIAMAVFNVVATAGASRLLFGMSRDGVIPLPFLDRISKKNKVPANSILIIVFIQLIAGSISDLNTFTQVVNFGALFGFTMLNIGAFAHLLKHSHSRYRLFLLFIPVIGALLNFWLLSHLSNTALIVGIVWLIAGMVIMIFNKNYRFAKIS